METPLHYMDINALGDAFRRGELFPDQVTGSLLQRIRDLDDFLKSYATLNDKAAMKTALARSAELRAGQCRGPLHGIPIAVKDLVCTKGLRTAGGLKVRHDFVPDYDATVISKLAAAGAVLLGKLNLTEGALSAYHSRSVIPLNPWGEHLWAGVSSSGSGVATAAGLCFGSLGTDTGGSIRYPAMANGIVGLKPTRGRVSRHGVMELAGSLDHVGPMTRTVRDAAIMLEAIAGHDDNDPTTLDEPVPDISGALDAGVEGVRIGVDEAWTREGTDPELVAAIETVISVLEQLGARRVAVQMPRNDPVQLRELWLRIVAWEAARAHADTFPERAGDYGDYLGGVLKQGAAMSRAEYADAMALRGVLNDRFEQQLDRADAVLCPAGGCAFEVDREAQRGDATAMREVTKHFQGQFTLPASLAGTPALVVPCGFADDGRPLTVQLLGSRLSEAMLCRIGHAWQQATQWHLRHPPL